MREFFNSFAMIAISMAVIYYGQWLGRRELIRRIAQGDTRHYPQVEMERLKIRQKEERKLLKEKLNA